MIVGARLAVVGAWAGLLSAQAPKQLLEAFPPSPVERLAKLEYVNPFDGSHGEAVLEIPKQATGPLPLIITPHGGNWTQEMNRSLWSGVADQFGVILLYPTHQGKLNPRVSLGSMKQIGNLEAAVAETRKHYRVDARRIYSAGLSQGALETLLLVGRNPGLFAGALSINGIPDLIAFYNDTGVPVAPQGPPDEEGLRKLRAAQLPALHKAVEADLGGTPDTVRKEYYLRSAVTYSTRLAKIPLIVYWAEDDELIPYGATHQGGMLAGLLRSLGAPALTEVKHSGGHGYPFYRVDLNKMTVKMFPREIFLDSVRQLLSFQKNTEN